MENWSHPCIPTPLYSYTNNALLPYFYTDSYTGAPLRVFRSLRSFQPKMFGRGLSPQPFSPCTIPVAVKYPDPHSPFSPCTIPVAVPYPDPHEKWKRLVQATISDIPMRKALSGNTLLLLHSIPPTLGTPF